MASPCMATSGPHASCANSFSITNAVVSWKEKCRIPNGHLFGLTLSYVDAVPEEKKESTFLFFDDIFTQNEKL